MYVILLYLRQFTSFSQGLEDEKQRLENSLREKGEKLQDVQQKLQESETELKTKVSVKYYHNVIKSNWWSKRSKQLDFITLTNF